MIEEVPNVVPTRHIDLTRHEIYARDELIDEIKRLRGVVFETLQIKSTKRKIFLALIVGALSLLATLASIANSGINYRQMRAIEIISTRHCSAD
jgi:hypothetical protein